MKSKLFKCALSFALASALVFCTTLICYTQIEYSVSADTVLSDDFKALGEAYLNAIKKASNGDLSGYFNSLSDIPSSWFKLLSDGTSVISPVDGISYSLDSSGELSVHSGGGGSHSGGIVIPSENFKEAVEEANTNNAPKGKCLWKSSYRTDTFIHSNYDSSFITLWESSDIGDSFSDGEIYIYPFYTDYNGITYYSDYQFRLYYDMYINGDITDYAIYVETLKYVDGVGFVSQSDSTGKVISGKSMDKPYTICIYFPYRITSSKPHLQIGLYYSQSDYYNNVFYCPSVINNGLFTIPSDSVNFSNLDSSISVFYSPAAFGEKYSDFYYEADGKVINAPERTDIDIGYICSNEMISRVYSDVDTTKIPDNYYVTITGDTIYDYSITNPETGQSETINYYITNNYILPDNGSSGGSGGTVGGDITVGGQIDVTGNVGVDVNVNINNGGNGGENIGDYIDASGADVDVGGLLGKLPSLSKGFVDYLKGFFAWLPAEYYGLIILILVISVWNVFRSRR